MANELVLPGLIIETQPTTGSDGFPSLVRDPDTGLICIGPPPLSALMDEGQVFIGSSDGLAVAKSLSGAIAITTEGVTSLNSGVIVNVNIASNAAISRSKFATGSAYRLVVNDVDGLMSDAGAITANRLLVADANGVPTHTAYEISVLDNILSLTSSAQDQLDVRLEVNITSPIQGDIIYFDGDDWVNLGIGASGEVITSSGSVPVWSTATANGVPSGGTTSQVLIKTDNDDYNTEWHTLVLADVTNISVTASELNLLSGLTVTSTVINLLDGADSNIQDQLSNKLTQALTYHSIFIGGPSDTAIQVAPGTEGSVFTIVSGHPTWQSPPTPGNVSGPVSSTDNAIVRWNLTDGTSIQNSSVIIDDSMNISGVASITPTTGSALRSATSAGNTLLIQAYDVDGSAYTTFITLTANNTPTMDINTAATIGSAYIYRVGGTDVALADGGTGASLVDPGADRIMFWDDSAGAVTWLTVGTNLSITGTTLDASGSGTYTFTNGLTDSAGTVRLGGTINNTTTLLTLSNNNTFIISAPGSTTASTFTIQRIAEDSAITISSTNIDFQVSESNGALLTDDRATPLGFQYFADYSSTFTARSLVDKAYVDARTLSSLTTNRIPYATSATTLGDDSALTWNATNNALTVSSIRIHSTGNGTGNSTFVGSGAGNFTATNGDNSAFGSSSGSGLTSGGGNTFLGASAGSNVTSGGNNLIIGKDISAQSAIGSNQLSIQNIIFGVNNSSTGTTVSSGSIGIGEVSPTRKFEVAGSVAVKAGTSTGQIARVGGVIKTDTTTTGNVGIGEDTLQTYSVPADTLSTDGGALTGTYAGTFGASLNNKRLRLKFGATTIFDSGILAITAATDWALEFEIIRTGATTQKCNTRLNTSSGTLSAYSDYSTAGETLSGAVTLLLTGEATADNDIVKEMFKLRWEPAEN
jgi:hypothetical protein